VTRDQKNSKGSKMVAKIIGDHTFSEFISSVRLDEILQMPVSFRQVSTITSLALEMDSKGAEKILILGCLTGLVGHLQYECDLTAVIDRLRVIFDSYLMGSHEVYVCPPLSIHSARVTKLTQVMERTFIVSIT
jgi:hypothetical protein